MSDNGSNPRIRKLDHRCPRCGRLWFRAYLAPGTILSIRCTKCSCMTAMKVDDGAVLALETELVK